MSRTLANGWGSSRGRIRFQGMLKTIIELIVFTFLYRVKNFSISTEFVDRIVYIVLRILSTEVRHFGERTRFHYCCEKQDLSAVFEWFDKTGISSFF